MQRPDTLYSLRQKFFRGVEGGVSARALAALGALALPPPSSHPGISRDSLHKRRETGGKQKKYRKKRK